MKALQAEFLKLRHSPVVPASFIAFAIAPLMGAVIMVMVANPEAGDPETALSLKAQAMNFTSSWQSYLSMLAQAVGVGGVMVFGFVASWLFGREYSDQTATDLLALPTARSRLVNGKFGLYIIWCLALAGANLLLGVLLGLLLQLPPLTLFEWVESLQIYFITTLLTILLGCPLAFFAMWGRGYLAPLAAVALTLVLSQIMAAIGFGIYFPWALPGIYSGAAGEYRNQLEVLSYLLLGFIAVLGYLASLFYWKNADHH